MKKLVFAFAAIVAVSFASCGGNTAATEAEGDSIDNDSVEQITRTVDSLGCDSLTTDSVD